MFPQNPPPGNPQQYYQDFANRYQQSPQDVSDQEALNNYHQVAPQLPPAVYQQAAQDAFARMSPEERMQFGREFQGYARQEGYGDFIDRDHDGRDDRFQDPDYLAGMTSRMHQQQPDLLGNLMGGMMGGRGGMMGGGGSMMSNPIAKAAMAGIASMAVRRMMGGR